jgi:predicted FMN-binding regulatory protein PaiB
VTAADRPMSWWPPKAGDLLRHATAHGAGAGRVKHVEALLHVLAVFDHQGATRIVTAEWFPTKRRWNYVVRGEEEGRVGLIWPDGKPRPKDP